MTVANLTATISLQGKVVAQARPALLDVIPGALYGHSLKCLSSTYKGPTFNLRRSSDNAAQDFTSTLDGGFPFAAVQSFLGLSTGFLTKIYDQTGNGRHAAQATAAQQPQLTFVDGQPEFSTLAANSQYLSTQATMVPASATYMLRGAATSPTAWNMGGRSLGSFHFAGAVDNSIFITVSSVPTAAVTIRDSISSTVASTGNMVISNNQVYHTYAGIVDDLAKTISLGFDGVIYAPTVASYSASRSGSPRAYVQDMGGDGGTQFGDDKFTHQILWPFALTAAQLAQADAIMSAQSSFSAAISAAVRGGVTVKQSKIKLLDIVAGGWLAVSIYPLSSTYTGPLFNCRRSSDNATQDFYATGGDFPYQAFADFVGSGTGFLTTLYDQTNSGQQNPSQAVAANQPIVAIGANGAEIQFPNATATWLQISVLQIPQNISYIHRVKSFSATWNGQQNPGVNAVGSQGNRNTFIFTSPAGDVKTFAQASDNQGNNFGVSAAMTASNITSYQTYGASVDDTAGNIQSYLSGLPAGSAPYASPPRRTGPTVTGGNLVIGARLPNGNMAITHFAAFSRVLSASEMALTDQFLQGTYAGALNIARAPITGRISDQLKVKPAAAFPAPLTATPRDGSRIGAAGSFPANVTARVASQARVLPALSFWATLRGAIACQLKTRGSAVYPAAITVAMRGATRGQAIPVGLTSLASFVRTAARVMLGASRLLYPAQPGPDRLIVLKTASWVESFQPFDTTADGPLTFDFVRLLAPGETIDTIDRFELEVLPASPSADPSPSERATGIAQISGTQVVQRFGDWLDLPETRYAVLVSVSTSNRNTKTGKAYLTVRQPAN